MTQVYDAVFEKGKFRVIKPKDISLLEGQKVRLIVESVAKSNKIMELATSVYTGLSEAEINEIEKIALDREHFFDKDSD